MYSFKDIPYATDWYREAHLRFIKDQPLPLKQENTGRIAAQGFRHTTSHGRVALQEAVFESGCGSVLRDVDGNLFLDMGSGVYVTNLGHAHPKVAEAVARHARSLMNCHDYMTPVKAAFLEKLADAVGGDLGHIHLYDNGTTAVEFGIRAIRAITGKHEIISCFSDHHGKTMGSAALGRISPVIGPSRLPGFYLVPRPDPYRPIWVRADGSLDTEAYLDFYDLFIREATTGQVAAFILEPIQGWGVDHSSRRLIPQAGRVLPAPQHLANDRRNPHGQRPHRPVAVYGPLERASRPDGAGQRVGERLPHERSAGKRGVCRGSGQDRALNHFWGQSHGVRGRPGDDGSDRG